jgi:23S rRNA (uracil1939-C5)-methyltransferase
MLQPGQTLSLSIEKPAAGGRMIARADGQVVLVSGAIPGERVDARIERVGRGVAYADVVSVTEPSADRRVTQGDPLCGGCLYSHITYARQLDVKALVIEDGFGRIGHLPVPAPVSVAASAEDGYRMRARLHLRGGQVGFFREGTHEVCPARQTRQLRADTCEAIDRLAAGLRSLALADVRELEVSENVDASQRVVHLESVSPLNPRTLSGLGHTDGLTGLTITSARGSATLVAGDPHVIDTIALEGRAVRLRRHVQAFFQGNRFLLSSLVQHVVGHVGPGDRVVDLYAGTGLFAIAAAGIRDGLVTAVEGDRAAAADLAANARDCHGSVEPVHLPVEAFVARAGEPPSVLIVDPPRTGMSKEALQGAITLGARTVVYVSCDVATLARDARRFVDAGYTLDAVKGFDLFPNTPHVETVATFGRSRRT